MGARSRYRHNIVDSRWLADHSLIQMHTHPQQTAFRGWLFQVRQQRISRSTRGIVPRKCRNKSGNFEINLCTKSFTLDGKNSECFGETLRKNYMRGQKLAMIDWGFVEPFSKNWISLPFPSFPVLNIQGWKHCCFKWNNRWACFMTHTQVRKSNYYENMKQSTKREKDSILSHIYRAERNF